MKVGIISFSGRKNGNCEQTGCFIQKLTGGLFFSFAERNINACGKCDYECFRQGQECPYIEDDALISYEQLAECDEIYYVIPNYCDNPCSNFFIWNERSQCFFQKQLEKGEIFDSIPKYAVIISNTQQDIFDAILQDITKKNLFLRAMDFGKISIDGDLLSSVEVQELIQGFVAKK